MKVGRVKTLFLCLVMAGLMLPGARPVSIALEPPQTKEDMLIRGEGDRLVSGPASAPAGGTRAMEQRPVEPARAVAALMERKSVKAFFAVVTHTTDAPARLDAFAQVVASLSADEVGDIIGMLRDTTVPPSKWEEAFAPLADVVTAEDRTAMVRALQDRAVRHEVLKSLEQVQLFKAAQAREALERPRK